MLSDVQRLSIKDMGSHRRCKSDHTVMLEKGDVGVVWFPLLRSSPAVDALQVSWRLAGSIALMINDAPEDMITQVLPALQELWLDDKDDEMRKVKLMTSTEQFLDCHPVLVIVNSHDQFVEKPNPR